MQRPIIQDMNSQNLLKRLEEGSSENQLRQNFVTRQSLQTSKPRKKEQGANKASAAGEHHATESSSSRKGGVGPQDRRSTLQVEQQKSQPSRLSQMSQQQ